MDSVDPDGAPLDAGNRGTEARQPDRDQDDEQADGRADENSPLPLLAGDGGALNIDVSLPLRGSRGGNAVKKGKRRAIEV
jgi:hypothetical protein